MLCRRVDIFCDMSGGEGYSMYAKPCLLCPDSWQPGPWPSLEGSPAGHEGVGEPKQGSTEVTV